jgi:O-antigen chain-terminating methyltransferase
VTGAGQRDDERGAKLSLDSETVDTIYRAVVGHPADAEALRFFAQEFEARRLDRMALVDALLATEEFRTAASASSALRASLTNSIPFSGSAEGFGAGLSERVVEVPWVLSRYRGEPRVLDLGASNAPTMYRELLGLLGVPGLVSVDLVPGPATASRGVVADVRALPFAAGSVDLVFCVSTLEHVGRENSIYGVTAELSDGGDVAALRELRRVLTAAGRLLVTVPFGRREDHGWFVQYDGHSWDAVVAASGLRAIEEQCFVSSRQGWIPARGRSKAAKLSYDADGRLARSVLCAELAPAATER